MRCIPILYAAFSFVRIHANLPSCHFCGAHLHLLTAAQPIPVCVDSVVDGFPDAQKWWAFAAKAFALKGSHSAAFRFCTVMLRYQIVKRIISVLHDIAPLTHVVLTSVALMAGDCEDYKRRF